MAAKVCPGCKSKNLQTDYSAGNVVCQDCGIEVEQGILVSEIGFSEGAGGRVHVQGTFVSHHSTGINGNRVGGGENVKEEGRKRIQMVCNQMGIAPSVQRGAQRFFSLAVDNKFNRGRRTDFVVASCIYLYSRFEKDALMLIDFSERLQINVYELGATYLKLRSCLNLDQILPEIDPAVYNIRFANRLDFGPMATTVARDASRLIKRFKADWMTAGRRPAGICGACLVIAARMSDFLRTPEEVAQVVKVSPLTIKKRLVEFAGTAAANKTVEEWRALTDADLEAENADELPPIMKKQMAKMAAQRVKRERSETASESREGSATPGADNESRKRKLSDDTEAIRAVARDVDVEGSEADEGDEGMEPLAKEDYVKDIQDAGDNSEEAIADRKRERRMLMASLKEAEGQEADEEELQMAVEDAQEDGKEDESGDGEPLNEVGGVAPFNPLKDLPAPPDLSDKEALYAYCEKYIFTSEDLLYAGNTTALREKIDAWVKGRDPTEVVNEMRRVVWARNEREWFAKNHREEEFDDLDDEELDKYWVMSEDERQTRARMWLSHNGKWLEEDRERQEKKAEYNRQHGIDPNKPQPKKKRRRNNAEKQKGPYVSTHAAMEAFASQKKFSTRINQEVLKRISTGEGLQRMHDDEDEYDEDDKDDEKDDEKYDEKEDEYEFGGYHG